VIVVDTNVIAYLLIQGAYSNQAAHLLRQDSMWIAPPLWRSELRSVLTQYFRGGHLDAPGMTKLMVQAEELMAGNEVDIDSTDVFELVAGSSCSAYDCEFVALAKRLNLPLYTSDKRVLEGFPEIATDLKTIPIG
jgi:predicted nucleic acid-binding protein